MWRQWKGRAPLQSPPPSLGHRSSKRRYIREEIRGEHKESEGLEEEQESEEGEEEGSLRERDQEIEKKVFKFLQN